MPDGMSVPATENKDTQLHTIRDLMLAAAQRGAWMTLGEIAGLTEIGEASVSAQLRHLRKWRHGGHCVEKRRRRRSPAWDGLTRGARAADKRRSAGVATMWEYRVLPPVGWYPLARSHGEDVQHQPPNAFSASDILGPVESCGTEEARCSENGCGETERDGASANSPQQAAGEVSDAEARD